MLPSPQLLNKVANFIQEQGKLSYYCLFLLGEKAGLRVSEAVNFNLNLKQKQNLYLIKGKRHKKRAVFVEPQVISELQKINWKPQQTNRFSYAHFLQKVKKELEIPANIELTPHTLRRCFATYQSLNGMPLPVLQQVLGHASIRTTALYWKNSEEPKEKLFVDKWLVGKEPQEPSKAIEDKPKKLLQIPVINKHGKFFLIIYQKTNIFVTSNQLTAEKESWKVAFNEQREQNKLLQEKVKQLEQENKDKQQIINNLKNDKKRLEELNNSLNALNKELEKQLIQVQKKKAALLKLLSVDLKNQYQNLSQLDNKENNQELHQQLIAQIETKLK